MQLTKLTLITLGLAVGLASAVPSSDLTYTQIQKRDGWLEHYECDYHTGIEGEGKEDCIAACIRTWGNLQECVGSRCIARNGASSSGRCYCTCG